MARARSALLLAAAVAGACLGGGPSRAAPARYLVRPGDPLSGIAARHHLTVAKLVHLNGLDPAKILPVGIWLRLPAAPVAAATERYRVRSGDTLTGIAHDFGTTVAAIA